MGKAGGGRNIVDPRFISMFAIYNVSFPDDSTLSHIYKSILSGHLEIFPEEIRGITDNLIYMTLELYKVFCRKIHIIY